MKTIIDFRAWIAANNERAQRETRLHATFVHGTNVSHQMGVVHGAGAQVGGQSNVITTSLSGKVRALGG